MNCSKTKRNRNWSGTFLIVVWNQITDTTLTVFAFWRDNDLIVIILSNEFLEATRMTFDSINNQNVHIYYSSLYFKCYTNCYSSSSNHNNDFGVIRESNMKIYFAKSSYQWHYSGDKIIIVFYSSLKNLRTCFNSVGHWFKKLFFVCISYCWINAIQYNLIPRKGFQNFRNYSKIDIKYNDGYHFPLFILKSCFSFSYNWMKW